MDGLSMRENRINMDDNWGYPNFRKPQYVYGSSGMIISEYHDFQNVSTVL